MRIIMKGVIDMNSIFIDFFESGDPEILNTKLLHSSSWKQNNVTAFGHAQINQLLSDWIALVGRCNVKLVSEIKDGDMHHIMLQLTPTKGEQFFLISLWVKHNDNVIKRVNCIVDTLQLTKSKKITINQIRESLPNPDPLQIPDLDHQDHLQNCHAVPSMLIDNAMINTGLLDKWWSIWTCGQLKGISQLYSEDAYIYNPQHGENCSPDSLFNSIATIRSLFVRKLCQIEHISMEENRVAISWYLDGDDKLLRQRVRINCCSLLEINSDQISKDIFIFDTAAQLKLQSESALASFAA